MKKSLLTLCFVLSISTIACGSGSSSNPNTTPDAWTYISTGEYCGNGIVETYLTRINKDNPLLRHEEQCDDGNLIDGDACPSDCNEIVTVVEDN